MQRNGSDGRVWKEDDRTRSSLGIYYCSPIKDTMHTSMELEILIAMLGIDLTCLPTLVKQRREMEEANERSPK